MHGVPGFATGPRGGLVFDFRKLELALDARATFSGGGGRQRRRIRDAVGPVRWNWMGYARNFAAWPAADATVTPNDLANPFDPGTFADKIELAAVVNARIFKDAYGASIVNGDIVTVFFDTYAASPTDFNLSANAGPSYGQWLPEVTITVPAGWKRHKLTFPAVSGLTTDTFVRLYFVTRDSVSRTFWLDRVHLKVNNDAVEPFIDTPGGVEVSTTDWPRRTLGGNGTTPQYGDGGWWVTDGTANLGPSKVVGPTGYPMSKLARRNTNGDGVYAYQSAMTFIAGEKYARRVVAQAGDEPGDTVFLELATNPGNYMANGTVNVRTGAVSAVNNGTITLVGQIGKQFIFEMRGTAPATVTTGYCSWIIPNGGTAGEGHYFGCDQVEHSEVCTAHMHSGLGQYGSAVTPPFGELVDVDAGDARIRYGEDGFSRGVQIEGPTSNLLDKSQDEISNGSLWTHYELGPSTSDKVIAPDNSYSSMKFVSLKAAPGTAHQCYQLGKVIASPALYSGSVHLKSAEVEWVMANLYDSTGDHRVWFHLPTLTVGTTPAGFTPFIERAAFGHVRIGLQGVLAASVNAGFSFEITTGDGVIFSTIPLNHGLYVWGANFGPGPYSSYIPGNSPSGAVASEALKFMDMETFGLNQDAWTIIVEATEPASDPTPGYPMILRMTGPGGVVATINKQPDGQIEFQIYDGATNVAQKLPAGTVGTARRYILSFDRASQTMRYAATGVPPASATGASLATVGPYTVVQISSADGFWWCNSIISKVETYPYLMSAEEMTRRL